jgi:ABC-type amino acid transport substrate-binding protein/cytochrome c5
MMGFWHAARRFAGRRGLSLALAALGAGSLMIASAQAAPALAMSPAAAAPALRVCLDPDDLPFSSGHPGDAGIYTEYSRQIAALLGRGFEPVWSQSFFGKFIVRTTLLARKCDAFIGLPVGLPDGNGFMGKKLVFSKPFIHVGFLLAVHPDATVATLDDLKGKTVAVQFGTPPQIMLADHDDIRTITFLSPEEAMAAMRDGRADAAFVWGPSAGYAAKKSGQAVRFVTIPGDGMAWTAGIGFAKADTALRDQVNRAIDQLAPTLAALQVKYGLPADTPAAAVLPASATLAAPATVAAPAVVTAAAAPAQPAPASAPAATPPQVADAAAGGDFLPSTAPDAVDKGRQIFNGTCAHCHGPDAIQSVKRINLRLLHHRYGDTMDHVFSYTVTHGRPSKGMPNWTGAFSDQEFSEILAFLHSVQVQDKPK